MPSFGSSTILSGGTVTITLPPNSKYWYIQNQDTAPLKIAFSDPSFGPVVLNAATATGAAGDWLDSVGFPFFGTSVTLTSTVAAAQFSSGYSLHYPTVVFSTSLASPSMPG